MVTYELLQVKDGYAVVRTRKFLGLTSKKYLTFVVFNEGERNYLLFGTRYSEPEWFSHINISDKQTAEKALAFCQLMRP